MNEVISKSAQIAALRQEILAMQGFGLPLENERMETGLGPINHAFPNHTFPTGAVHEFLSSSPEEAAATAGFMAGLIGTLMQRKGASLWVSTSRTLFPPALKIYGIEPDQVIFIDVRSNREALWVIEEGLKCETLAAVVGEVRDLSFTESRRLQLAVEQSHVTGFIHRNVTGAVAHIACVSRWRIMPLASISEAGMPGVGFPGWQVELSRIRNGRPGLWQVHWATGTFRVITRKVPALTRFIRKAG